MKESIILDLDGTLWDTSKEIENVWNNVARKYGLTISLNQIKNIMGFTKEEIIKYLFQEDLKKGNEFITKCQNSEIEYLMNYGGHIYKNTIETIKKLSSNYDLYIVSNCQVGYIEAFLKHYSIEKYFKDYECSGNTGLNKDKNIKIVLERNYISKAVYIGDSINDYESAIKNNLPFIWAEYGFGKCNVYYKKIKNISDLLKLNIFKHEF